MNVGLNIFKRIILRSVQIPYQEVGCASDAFLSANGKFTIVKKYLSRYLRLFIGGQIGREVLHIPCGARVLWLHTGKRNIGDALIEASGRSLLKNHHIQIDLLTLENLANVFEGDDVFLRIYFEASNINPSDYDYILMTEFNHRTIKAKIKYFKDLPYACMFGFFYGPDRNQTMFSFSAINHIFKLGLSVESLVKKAKPYMPLPKASERFLLSANDGFPFITIAIGGIDANRSYSHWGELLLLIDKSNLDHAFKSIILLGSDNGLAQASRLVAMSLSNFKVYSYVGLLSLKQSQSIIDQSLRFVGCDGGLMHVAHTTSTPTVSIFAGEPHYLRLTESCHSLPIQGVTDVNDIPPDQILRVLKESLNTSFTQPPLYR